MKIRAATQPKTERYASVWDAIADTPEEAANLRAYGALAERHSDAAECASCKEGGMGAMLPAKRPANVAAGASCKDRGGFPGQ